jgi:pyruvate formate lyase activating enzyme
MKEALLYDRLENKGVRCALCAHRCLIPDGKRGICGVRENREGSLYSLVYGKVIARDVDPVEKKPLFHFLPGTLAYSIATVGCNFTCLGCQNHIISQYPRDHEGRIVGENIPPAEIVKAAQQRGCRSIAYTYTEPTIFFEYALETARLAHEEGIRNIFVSNGYMTAEAIGMLVPYLDAINIDLKGISDDFYHRVVGGSLNPVLRSIEQFVQAGVWVEVTTLVIPGLNDGSEALRSTAEAIRGISETIPWHISRFYPAYRLPDVPPTPVATLEEAQRIGQEVGLRYVYMGNVPGKGENTHCPSCGEPVIIRLGFMVRENRLQEGCCPACDTKVDGIWFTAG